MLPKQLFVIPKLRLIGSTSFSFQQKTLHDFQNTVLNFKVALFQTNATKSPNLDRPRKNSVFLAIIHIPLTLSILLTAQEAFVDCG